MNHRALYLIPVVVISTSLGSRAPAEEANVENYHNSYLAETVEDWAKNCKITARLPTVGSTVPADVTLSFRFDKGVGRTGPYSYRTIFDLAISRDTAPFSYLQLGVPRSIGASPLYTSEVRFQRFPISLGPNQTTEIRFEIYADCEECRLGVEAKPPSLDVTSWRIFGKITCGTDSAGRVATCTLTDVGSEQPPKQLPSTNAAKFPHRAIPRPNVKQTSRCEFATGTQCKRYPRVFHSSCLKLHGRPRRRCNRS